MGWEVDYWGRQSTEERWHKGVGHLEKLPWAQRIQEVREEQDSGRDLEIIHKYVALYPWNPRGKALCRDCLSYSSYCQKPYSVSQEGREVVLGRNREHLFDLILVKKVKSWSSCCGGKKLGCVERNEHLKQLGWTGWEGRLLGKRR